VQQDFLDSIAQLIGLGKAAFTVIAASRDHVEKGADSA
jgi:hypothetical protein